MRRILYLVMVCILVSVFVSASNVSAINRQKIVNTEWRISGTQKMFDAATGEYIGAMIGGVGLVVFDDLTATGVVAPLVVSGVGVVAGATGTYTLDSYTIKGLIFTATSGSILITHPVAGTIEDYTGPIDFKGTLKTIKSFKATLKYTNGGVENIVKITGKFLGRFSPTP